MIVWVPTLALSIFLISGLLLTRSLFSALAFSISSLYVSSGLAIIVGLTTSLEYRELVLSILAIACLFASVIYALKVKKFATTSHWIGAATFVIFSFVSQIISRNLGLSSVAFGDGHSIILTGLVFQGAEGVLLTGTKALKRGFGLIALQSFGFEGEYLVGFLPIIFAAALILTIYLIWLRSPTKLVFFAVTSLILVMIFSTEAIMRHLFLMNYHSTAWLITAFFLIMISKHLDSKIDAGEIVVILVTFAAVAFLRLDFIFLFSPFILTFILVSARKNVNLAIGVLFAIAVPIWLWTTFAMDDFPFFGSFGPSVLVTLGVMLGGLVVWHQRKCKTSINPLSGNFFWFFTLLVVMIILASTNTLESLRRLFTNLFLGEGLWGYSVLILLLITLGSLVTKKVTMNREFGSISLRLFVASVAIYIFSKSLDGNSIWQVGTSWNRVGFGDSFNRTMVTWLPFYSLPMIRFFAHFLPQKSVPLAGKHLRKKSSQKKH